MKIEELVTQMETELSQEQKNRIKAVVDEKKSELCLMEKKLERAAELVKGLKDTYKKAQKEYKDLLATEIGDM